jgi:TRAP-type C4-dicarboxylate transport system substrate-binding protein
MTLRRFTLAPLVAAALAAGGAHAQTVLQVSTWLPPSHGATMAQNQWCEAVEKGTNGSVKCNLLAKPVSAPPGTFDAIRDGVADVSYTVDGYTPGRFVFTQVAEFPFLGDSSMATSLAYQRIYDKYFAPLGEHRGVKVLAVFTHGPGIIFTTKQPVNSAADAAKLKFRIGGGNINELSKLMGWNTTLKPATDSFELLSTGVMDGTFFPDESLQSMRLSMVRFATTFPGGLYNTSFVFMMNQAKYNSLKPEERAVIDRVSGEAASRLFAAGWDRTDAASRDIQRQTGVQRQVANEAFVNDVRAKQSALEDRWVAAAEGRGLKNARAVLAEFRAEAQKAR